MPVQANDDGVVQPIDLKCQCSDAGKKQATEVLAVFASARLFDLAPCRLRVDLLLPCTGMLA